MDYALKLHNVFRNDCFDEDTRIRKCSEAFRKVLEDYNNRMKDEISGIAIYAVDNALAGLRYERIQNDGPHFRVINFHYPLFVPYFTHTGTDGKSLGDIEKMMYNDGGKFFMGHNGKRLCDGD